MPAPARGWMCRTRDRSCQDKSKNMTQRNTRLPAAFRLAGLTLISGGLLHAADQTLNKKDQPAQELPATVVTATKTETEVTKTAASICAG